MKDRIYQFMVNSIRFAFGMWVILAVIILALMLYVVFSSGKAHAHSWYSAYCCSGKDCVPIPANSVKTTKYGYKVHLTPKEHPSLNTPFDYTVPYDKVQMSEDSEYHACIMPNDPDVLRCLYVPNMGF